MQKIILLVDSIKRYILNPILSGFFSIIRTAFAVKKRKYRNAAIILAMLVLIQLPTATFAEMTSDFTGCPCTAGSWPSLTFVLKNNSAYPITLDGVRFQTTNYAGWNSSSCTGGGTVTQAGAGPYTTTWMFADWDRIRPVGSTLNTYSCSASVGAGKDGTPINVQVLAKEGACNVATPVATPPAITCAQVDAVKAAASYYSTTCIPDWLGKNGGTYSGGVLDNFLGQTQIQVAIPNPYTLNSVTVTLNPYSMGNPMYMMAVASTQEYFSFDMQYLMAIGAKETQAAIANGGGTWYDSFYTNADGAYGPWEVEDATFAVLEQCYPNFFPKYACIAGFVNVTAAIGSACYPSLPQAPTYYMTTPGYVGAYKTSAQLVNSAVASALNFYRMYQSLVLSTDLCFFNLLENGHDDEAAAKILPAGYNLGINSGFESGALPPSAGVLAAADISTFTTDGNNSYRTNVMKTAHELENASCSGAPIYDAPITQTLLENYFFGDAGTPASPQQGGLWVHFNNLYTSQAARQQLWDDVLCAFNKLKGQVPVAQQPTGYTANDISYRYDFLTILRVAKQYLALTVPFPTQADFTAWVKARSLGGTACGVTIDKTYPTLSITSPNPLTYTSQCKGFTVNFTATDNVAVKGTKWSLDPNWISWNDASGSAGTYTAVIPSTDANYPATGAAGKLWIKVTDDCGNSTIQELRWVESCGTPTATATNTNTNTPTFTRTMTPSVTNTYTPTCTRTNTQTYTVTFTMTNTPTPTPTYTFTSTKTMTATASATFTITTMDTATITMTRTFTNTITMTSTVTPAYTKTASPTITMTWTYTQTPTATPTVTMTSTPEPANIAITMEALDTSTTFGGTAEIKIILHNTGDGWARDVNINDILPAEVDFQGTGSSPDWVNDSGNISLIYGDIAPGEYVEIRLVIKVKENITTDTINISGMIAKFTDDLNPDTTQVRVSNPVQIKIGEIQIYPNPFNPSKAKDGKMKFMNIPRGMRVTIYTITGEKVNLWELHNSSSILWDGTNMYGKNVSSGIYYYVIQNGNNSMLKMGKIFISR